MNITRIFLFLLFCSITFSSVAQNFRAGLIAGLSTTQVAGDQLSGFNKAGVMGGGFVNREFSEQTSLQMEIYFIQKGSRKPLQSEADNQFYVMRLSYVEIPLLLQWKAGPKLIFEAGPSIAVLIFSEEEREYGAYEPFPPFEKTDLSGQFGISYPLSEKLNVNSRFSQSIIPIRPFVQSSLNDFFNEGQYNTVISFDLQYRFGSSE